MHLGSLLAAVASYLDAHAQHGQWLLRIEDIDPPRQQQGASETIIHSLRAHGLQWHGDIIWQSQHHALYKDALEKLHQQQLLFACTCTRKALKKYNAYPGTCRHKSPQGLDSKSSFAWRLNTSQAPIIKFDDALQGQQVFNLDEHGGDFILQRKDQLYAYHLAVSVDDDAQKISHIVRGIDLLDNTAQHIFLQQCLSFKTPHYLHIPVLIDDTGNKLSKQFGAPAIDDNQAQDNLRRVLGYLQQPAPATDINSCEKILDWAIKHWQPQALANIKQVRL